MDQNGIEIEPTAGGVSIHLPFRQLGSGRKIGWVPLAFGVFVSLFMLAWIGIPMSWGIDLLMQGQLFGLLFIGFCCLGFSGLFFAAKVVTLGISILIDRTRSTVEVTDTQIVNRERFGWFSHKLEVDRKDVSKLFVTRVSSLSASPADDSQPAFGVLEFLFGNDLHKFFAITGKEQSDKPVAAPFYPEILVQSVAKAIAEELNRDRSISVQVVHQRIADEKQSAAPARVVTVQQFSEDETQKTDFVLPVDSQLEVVDQGDSKVYKVPGRNLREGSHGLFTFSVCWNGFILLISMFIFGGQIKADWGLFAFFGIFAAVGVGMFVSSIYMAWQSAMVGVKGGLLFIERKTIFGTRWSEFAAEDIESIEMAHANMEVNDKPVMNLRIKAADGKSASMFSHLDDRELQWLAQQLRRSLGVDAAHKKFAVGNFDPAEVLEKLPATDIEVIEEQQQTNIHIPAWTFPATRGMGVVGALMALLPLPAMLVAVFFFKAEFALLIFGACLTAIGVIVFAVNRVFSTREFDVVATTESIDVQVRGFLTRRDFSLPRSEVLSVDVVDSGAQINNQRMSCIRIKGTNGRGISMMTGRNHSELAYVARLIHQRLNLMQSTGAS